MSVEPNTAPAIRYGHPWLRALRCSAVVTPWLVLPAWIARAILPRIHQAPHRHLLSHIALGVAISLAFCAIVCYLVLPHIRRFYARRKQRLGMADSPPSRCPQGTARLSLA